MLTGLICGLTPILSGWGGPLGAEAAERTLPIDLERASAPVVIDGHTLFRVRGVSAYPAQQRARVIADHIEALAADEAVSVESLRVVETEGRSVISAGDQPVMNVLDADAALVQIARQPLALLYRTRIAEVITAFRHDRSPRALLIGAGHAVVATVLAALLAWGIRLNFQRLRRFTERRFKARIQGLQFQSFQIVQAERLWAGIQTAERRVYVLLMLAVAFLYLEYVLALFPWTKATSLKLFTIFLNPIRQMAAAVLAAVPNLVFLAILILVVRYGLQMLRLFFSGIARGTLTLARLRPRMGHADLSPLAPGRHCLYGRDRLSLRAGLPIRGLQGRVYFPWRDPFARIVFRDFERHCRLHHDLSPRVQGGRPGQDRRPDRGRHGNAPAGDPSAVVEE